MHIDRVGELQRWVDAGAIWRVVGRSTDAVTVALFRCDGGEEMERFTSDDARLLAFVGGRHASDE